MYYVNHNGLFYRNRKMKTAIIDNRADEKAVYCLENMGLKVIPTIKIPQLYDAVATHADIQIHYLGQNSFVCAPEAFEYYKKHLPNTCTLIKGSKSIGSAYPYDILYNTAVLKDFAICNSAYTAIEILSEYKRMNKNILNVKQGYSKCSTAVVSDNAIITADVGIYKSAVLNNIDALKITEGNINLRGMDYGFIGGATGLIDKHTLAVNGNINTHPDADKIKKFCTQCGTELIMLNDGILTDMGSIIANFDA